MPMPSMPTISLAPTSRSSSALVRALTSLATLSATCWQRWRASMAARMRSIVSSDDRMSTGRPNSVTRILSALLLLRRVTDRVVRSGQQPHRIDDDLGSHRAAVERAEFIVRDQNADDVGALDRSVQVSEMDARIVGKL